MFQTFGVASEIPYFVNYYYPRLTVYTFKDSFSLLMEIVMRFVSVRLRYNVIYYPQESSKKKKKKKVRENGEKDKVPCDLLKRLF